MLTALLENLMRTLSEEEELSSGQQLLLDELRHLNELLDQPVIDQRMIRDFVRISSRPSQVYMETVGYAPKICSCCGKAR